MWQCACRSDVSDGGGQRIVNGWARPIDSFALFGWDRGRGGPTLRIAGRFPMSSSDRGMQSGGDSRRCVVDPLALVAVCRLAHRGG
jgi:hypothetical protein